MSQDGSQLWLQMRLLGLLPASQLFDQFIRAKFAQNNVINQISAFKIYLIKSGFFLTYFSIHTHIKFLNL